MRPQGKRREDHKNQDRQGASSSAAAGLNRRGRLDYHGPSCDSGITGEIFDVVSDRVSTGAICVDRIFDNDSVANVAIDIIAG